MSKLCPFKKKTIFFNNPAEEHYNEFGQTEEYTHEEFLPCSEIDCMMWDGLHNTCSLRNRYN